MDLADEAAPRSSIGEFHDGVVTLLEELSQFRDGGLVAAGVAGDAKQQLMLLRRDAATPGGLFTEAQEFAQRVTKPGKMANGFLKRRSVRQMLVGRTRCHGDNYIVIRCIAPPTYGGRSVLKPSATVLIEARQKRSAKKLVAARPGKPGAANSGGKPPHSTAPPA